MLRVREKHYTPRQETIESRAEHYHSDLSDLAAFCSLVRGAWHELTALSAQVCLINWTRRVRPSRRHSEHSAARLSSPLLSHWRPASAYCYYMCLMLVPNACDELRRGAALLENRAQSRQ